MEKILGQSEAIRRLNALVKKVAPAKTTVLIEGESGTGKELVAKAIHLNSNRCRRPFVPVNCGAFAESLIESELFGHEKGAFTGAIQAKPGRFERANGGTLFLDEIGELSPQGQVNLLRVLQEQQLERVGGDRMIPINVRIVAATHRNLEEGVRDGWFREDLFYRLHVIQIRVPPLRERKEDIPVLANAFCRQFSEENAKSIQGITRKGLNLLKMHHYPGNVRELQNLMERAVVLCDCGFIRSKDINLPGGRIFNWNAGSLIDKSPVRRDALFAAMEKLVIPVQDSQTRPWRRSLKKVSIRAIGDYLASTGGKEFTRADFTSYLCDSILSGAVSYKTVGEYLKILKLFGICTHNGGRANQSRYRLSERFIGKSSDCRFFGAPASACGPAPIMQPA